MKNDEAELKLQAYLDNELSENEARQIQELMSRDASLRILCEELRNLKSLLADNELERKLPESREFYWSKIAREIDRSAPQPEQKRSLGISYWLLRLVVPVAGTALLAVMFSSALRSGSPMAKQANYFHEIESQSQESAGISFRSEEAGMTVVWIDSQAN